MLYDKARIFVQGGAGGNGCQSFRREAHVPKGGPDGGDGGHGGRVELVCDASLRDLQSFKRKAHYKAGRGRHGEGALRHGASGEALVVRVPPGTQVTMDDGTVYDLVAPGQRVVVARGGSGGRGNKHFAGPTRQAPRFAERGLPGHESWIDLRLKLLADVGFVGLPNAGKSSLLGRMTRAAPKIGRLPVHDARAGARHARRRRAPARARRHPRADRGRERGARPRPRVPRARRAHAAARPRARARAARRVRPRRELPDDRGRAGELRPAARGAAAHPGALEGRPRARRGRRRGPRRVGGAAGRGRPRARHVQRDRPGPGGAEAPSCCTACPPTRRLPAETLAEPEALAEHRVFRPAADLGFAVERTGAGVFRVTGERVERLLQRFDVENEEAAAHVEHRLVRMGVIQALEERGFAPGDEVEIGGVVLELDPSA